MASKVHFILASQSPRRQELLKLSGYPFTVMVSGVDEDDTGLIPEEYVRVLSRRKGETIASQLETSNDRQSIVLAADTDVAFEGQILGKPVSNDDAAQMLAALRGRIHHVHTGMYLKDLSSGKVINEVHSVTVTMRDYRDQEMDNYVASGDPLDKAGAYAIQHRGFRPVVGLSGCYLAVMGLSLCHLTDAMIRLGHAPLIDASILEKAHNNFPCAMLAAIRPYFHNRARM